MLYSLSPSLLCSDYIADALKKSLNNQLCTIVNKEINTEGNKALSTLPQQIKIDKYTDFDVEMIAPPNLTSAMLATHHLVRITCSQAPCQSPRCLSGLTPRSESKRKFFVHPPVPRTTQGAIVLGKNGSLPLARPAPMPVDPPTRMFTVYISAWTAMTAGFSYEAAGLLHFVVKPDDVSLNLNFIYLLLSTNRCAFGRSLPVSLFS